MQRSGFRPFRLSLLITILGLAGVGFGMGLDAALVALILIAVEITFSFDNAIINAKVLNRLSVFWHKLFLTVGVVIAIFGMRILFPIVIVAAAANLSISNVLHLALHDPNLYAEKLNQAHVSIAAFGGAFLLTLALQFFLDGNREELWLERLERALHNLSKVWLAPPLAFIAVLIVAFLPANQHQHETLVAGTFGVAVYSAMQLLNFAVSRVQRASERSDGVQHGVAALILFIYLQILDASFSFDSVIGAFAITDKIVLIAVGLGIGALWVRSLTVYIVQEKVLSTYKYLDHGAHYAILVLAVILLISVIVNVPDMIAGVMGLAIIGASLAASKKAV